ncbi:NAD(P)-binding protein [bacterium]|nr:NAD(P)-binding protein [bacterium]
MVDVLVLGSGPAGCNAAVYAAQAGYRTLILEGPQPGGQLTTTWMVDNFPGFPEAVDGVELMNRMRQHAEGAGAGLKQESIVRVDLSKRPFELYGESGQLYIADSLVVATGAKAKKLGLPHEDELTGRGVSSCAVCDGRFFKDKPVAVVGGGDTALEEAIYLRQVGCDVTLLVRGDHLRAGQAMRRKFEALEPPVPVRFHTELTAICPTADGSRLGGVMVRHTETGEELGLPVSGLFVAIGHTPQTQLFNGQLRMDEQGYLMTEVGSTQTSVDGVFAAGEVAAVNARYRQAGTAAGDGIKAGMDAPHYLQEQVRVEAAAKDDILREQAETWLAAAQPVRGVF